VIDDDPGWGEALMAAVPVYGRIAIGRRARERPDGLILMRQLFVSFCSAVLLFGIVLAVIGPTQRAGGPAAGPAGILLVVGAGSVVVGTRLERPLDGAGDATVLASYRTRFFVRIATSEVAALLGFVGFFTTGVWWVYPVSACITFAGFARAAPSVANLRRDQEQLYEQGSQVVLVRALCGLGTS
jgi:hypothetical protein